MFRRCIIIISTFNQLMHSIDTVVDVKICLYIYIYIYIYTHIYTGCHRRNGPNFGRVFLMLNYTDITQNTYIQSSTVTEIMAREKCGHLAFPRSMCLQPYREPPRPVVI